MKRRHTRFNRWLVGILTTALAITSVFAVPILSGTADSYAAGDKATYARPYPWSAPAAATTGDYIADSYDGIGAGHVFESVTQERLIDILRSPGDYYILFGGPEHITSQTVLKIIESRAKASGGAVKKIYHFDPVLDGYQLNITKDDGVFIGADGTSAYRIWTRITELLGTATPVAGFSADDTLLFLYNRDAAPRVRAWYSLKESELAGFGDGSAAAAAIDKVFRGSNEAAGTAAYVTGAERTEFDYFRTVYNGAATYNNKGTASAVKTGQAATELFTEADRAGFTLHNVTLPELLNILHSPGEHDIFFGASWCPNSQAVIADVQRKAKQFGKGTVYVYDTSLGNQLTFGAAGEVTAVLTANSGYNTRNSFEDPYNRAGYLYGELTKAMGDFDTENQSKAKLNGSGYDISYYPNGNLSGTPTSLPSWGTGDGNARNAIRLQLPFFFAYNKDAAGRKVIRQWLHNNTGGSTSTPKGSFQEYMLQYTWVLATEPAKALAGTPGTDGITPVTFAAEAIAELDYVFTGSGGQRDKKEPEEPPVTKPTTKPKAKAFAKAPVPVITGTAKVGKTLKVKVGKWSPKAKYSYKWYAGGKVIKGATKASYKLKKAQKGKKITVKVTAKKTGYITKTKTSKATKKVVK